MSFKELLVRYIVLVPGVFLLCFGIACITKAGLGTSPISSIPYSMSLILPRFTMGNYTIMINLLLLTAEWVLLQWLHPGVYWARMLTLLAGVCIMAFGIAIQMEANVAMAPGDAFARALTAVLGKPYNRVRVASDTTMVAIAASLCLIFLHNLAGAREGTVICALLCGNIVKIYRKLFAAIRGRDRWLICL